MAQKSLQLFRRTCSLAPQVFKYAQNVTNLMSFAAEGLLNTHLFSKATGSRSKQINGQHRDPKPWLVDQKIDEGRL